MKGYIILSVCLFLVIFIFTTNLSLYTYHHSGLWDISNKGKTFWQWAWQFYRTGIYVSLTTWLIGSIIFAADSIYNKN
jgi:hypothetical protein